MRLALTLLLAAGLAIFLSQTLGTTEVLASPSTKCCV